MKLINQNVVEVTEKAYCNQAALCEQVYRVSHLSESKGGDPMSFISKMVKMYHHFSGAEFFTIYLLVDEPELRKGNGTFTDTKKLIDFFKNNPYSRVKFIEKEKRYAITTNLRVCIENEIDGEWVKKHVCFPTPAHTIRRTFKITGCHQDYIDMRTHRVFSWLVESTRFCNYNKGKFGGEITYIDPWHIKKSRGMLAYRKTLLSLWVMEKLYKFIGGPAQECSAALSRLTKANFYMCGFEDDFDHFFELRADGATGHAHPLVQEIAWRIKSLMKK